jgi:hypothetical protein
VISASVKIWLVVSRSGISARTSGIAIALV